MQSINNAKKGKGFYTSYGEKPNLLNGEQYSQYIMYHYLWFKAKLHESAYSEWNRQI